MPEMIAVASSNIHRVGYVETEHALYVQFKTSLDKTYIYEDVPRPVFEALLAAPSKGTFVNQQIKGTYAYHTV